MKQMFENLEYCKRIAEELESIVSGQATNEDGEELTLWDWFNDALDWTYTIDRCGGYKSARIWVTLGGPNIWIDTEERAVKLAWGTDRAEYSLSYDVWDAIDGVMSEIWELESIKIFQAP